MKRRWVGFFLIWMVLQPCSVRAVENLPEQVVAVGQTVGIEVRCGGLMVVGFPKDSSAEISGVRAGDIITAVDGVSTETVEALRAQFAEKTQVTLTVMRRGRERSLVVPLTEADGARMLGVNVRSELAGIGTVTYYDPATAAFGALGHGITDGAGDSLFPVTGGFICRASVVGADRGESGTPGLLKGDFAPEEQLGTVAENTSSGIFGQLSTPMEGEVLPVAGKETVTPGPAEVLCTVEGSKAQRYAVELRRVFPMEDATGRNLLIRVTDPRLLEKTGGIVQGMSGSPILQNGCIIGAVTHVLVSDPTTGYGIFIENMLRKTAA